MRFTTTLLAHAFIVVYSYGPNFPIFLSDESEINGTTEAVTSCQNNGFLTSTGICNCPAYTDAAQCTDWQCVNGGYRLGTSQICNCPSGYLGIHCEPGA